MHVVKSKSPGQVVDEEEDPGPLTQDPLYQGWSYFRLMHGSPANPTCAPQGWCTGALVGRRQCTLWGGDTSRASSTSTGATFLGEQYEGAA